MTQGRRADAQHNRERLVAAAREALAGSSELALHQVAKAAGVGQGTLYRHFPTREHLLTEVYRVELGELVDAVAPLLAAHPADEALARWLGKLIDYARVKRGVVAAIEATTWQGLYADNHQRLDDAITTLLDAGREAGSLRDDVDAGDVVLLTGYLSRLPESQWDGRARHVAEIILDGLRTRPIG